MANPVEPDRRHGKATVDVPDRYAGRGPGRRFGRDFKGVVQ
jgi:hypothetical protein